MDMLCATSLQIDSAWLALACWYGGVGSCIADLVLNMCCGWCCSAVSMMMVGGMCWM